MMSTIPASQLVQVVPSVLNAGGDALVLSGLFLTQSDRVPFGQVLSFPNDGQSVARYFGADSEEAEIATVYFGGYNNSTRKPAAMLFTQYPSTALAAWLRGGDIAALTIPQLQAISGSLTVTVDGEVISAPSVDLSSATSYSAAAALIQTALADAVVTEATVTGAIAPATAAVTASISGSVMYVTDVTSGKLVTGALLTSGAAVGTVVTGQLSGDPGGVGTYAVSIAQTVDSTAVSATYGTLTVSAVSSGTLRVGQVLSGSGVSAGTQITELGTGEGLTGTYYVDLTQTVASTTITAETAAPDVSFDDVTGALVVTSGMTGAGSTIGFASGTIAADLLLTQATGAVLSQGAPAMTPGAFMTMIVDVTQNWATFTTLFDPDGGSGSVQRQAFAAWSNGQNDRWLYVAWDDSPVPTLSNDAASSLGRILKDQEVGGTCVVYDPENPVKLAAFVCGTAASIDFDATNGRITFAFRGQDGLVAGVTTATAAQNLIANGYDFYGAYATANQQFLEFQPGQMSGEFQWLDSYVNQIWLNNALQLALMNMLQQTNSVPYNQFGYDLISAACLDPINAALNFGAIRAGVTLSSAQAAEVNAAAGISISDTLSSLGWYLQVKDAAPITRQARQSPPINFWYMDGESVQQIVLASILIQ